MPSAATTISASNAGCCLALIVHDRFEHELDTERLAAMLQDVEQPLAPDAAEAMATGRDRASLEMDVDVVPAIEGAGDRSRRVGIGFGEIAERLIGKDDTPAERVVRAVALDDADMMAYVRALHQQRQIEAGRSATDAQDPHDRTLAARYDGRRPPLAK
jgi:hypothetical protein